MDTGSINDDYSELELSYPSLQIIQLKTKTGFARANNIGIKASTGDYFFLLNNDTIMKNNCLQLMVDSFQQYPELKLAGALGPPLSLAETDFIVPWDNTLINSDMVSGFAMMISRECINKIGYLEETYFLYGEDEEYGWRCNLAGYKVAYVRGAIVFHHRGGSKSQFNFQKTRNEIYNHIKLLDGMELLKALFSDLVIQSIGRTIRWPKDTFNIWRSWVWILQHLKENLEARRSFNQIKRYKSRHLRDLRYSVKPYIKEFKKLKESLLRV